MMTTNSLSLQLVEVNLKIQELQEKSECLETLVNELKEEVCKDVISTIILLEQSKTSGGDLKKSEPPEKELVRLIKVFCKCIMPFFSQHLTSAVTHIQ
jgi:hypothetical protein